MTHDVKVDIALEKTHIVSERAFLLFVFKAPSSERGSLNIGAHIPSPERVNTAMPSTQGERKKEDPESWKKEMKEDSHDQHGRDEHEQKAQVVRDEKDTEILIKPDSLCTTEGVHFDSTISRDTKKGCPGHCEERHNRKKELLLDLQPLHCPAQLFESVQRFLSPTPRS